MWADWTESVLLRSGFLVRAVGVAPPPDREMGRVVVLLSAAYMRSTSGRAQWEALKGLDGTGAWREPVLIRVGDGPLSGSDPVDLTGLDEDTAAAALLRALDRPALPNHDAVPTPRFPGTVPAVQNAPVRNHFFTGRQVILDALRDQLVTASAPLVVQGPTGVGKSQVALEYAHRFLADYDLVWWVPAAEAEQVVASLAELADRLDVPSAPDAWSAARQALDALNRGRPYARWLLVYDGAEDPQQMTPYVPEGGHTLITTRNPHWGRLAATLDLDTFLREESVEHLRRRVRDLSLEGAQHVADAVGDLPSAVDQAAVWLDETAMSADAYLEQLQE